MGEPSWPAVDPDAPPVRPRRRHVALVVVGLVAALAVPAGAVALGSTTPRTIPGTALPGPTQPAATSTTSSPPTSTTPPVRRISKLADHPLLGPGITLPDAPCDLPRFRRSAESLLPYYQELVRCMDAAWAPVLDAARLPHQPPHLNIDEHPGETGCGDPDADGEIGDFTALYCPTVHTLYLPVDRMLEVDGGQAASHVAVLAHEFSHHVQEESGMLWAAHQAIDKAGESTPQAQELSRRTELQANCLAGLFIAAAAGHGSFSRSLATQAIAEFRNGALPQTHGSRANQHAWARKGFQQRTTEACNTFAAPADAVS